jgi:hypothetical protein
LVTVVMMAPAVNNFPAAGQLGILEMQQNQTGQPEGPSEALDITSPPTPPSTDSLGSVLRLSNANIEIDIPMMRGFENGSEIFFIATDSSDNETATQITLSLQVMQDSFRSKLQT